MGKLLDKIMAKARLGDKVEYITKATGIKAAVDRRGGCSGCAKRKAILNGERLTADSKAV